MPAKSPSPSIPRYLNSANAAEYIGVSPSWLAHSRCPDHPYYGRGPRWVQPPNTRRVTYDIADLDSWAESHKRTGTVTVVASRRRGRPAKAEQIARRNLMKEAL